MKRSKTPIVYTSKSGTDILIDPMLYKGTAFTSEERTDLSLQGLLPYHISSLEEQVAISYQRFLQISNSLDKYIFLQELQMSNRILFYQFIEQYIEETLPYIYTPTVGEAAVNFSQIFRRTGGLYIPFPLLSSMEEIFRPLHGKTIKVIVVTDGERVLGLGDLGVGGMAISLGKSALYTLFGGINPSDILPIVLDVGTNNQDLLRDPHYIGWKHERVRGEDYLHFVDTFVSLVQSKYPDVVLQWEDFARPNAPHLLEKYRKKICSFNDDIQGTAAIVLAAIFSALQQKKETLIEQRIVIVGGGSAGLGIAHYFLEACELEGIPIKEARRNLYIVDRYGLVHTGQDAEIEKELQKFVQDEKQLQLWKVKNRKQISLLEVISNARPTILIGVTAHAGLFNEELIREMAKHTQTPIIFPLSNPTDKSEASFEHLIQWTGGKALIATGSPFPKVTYQSKVYDPSQCNNVYIYPGLGLGLVVSKSKEVLDSMFITAARVLSGHSKESQDSIFPGFSSLREVSREIAVEVARIALEEGLSREKELKETTITSLIDSKMWFPVYPNVRRNNAN
ncbi:MAG: NAD-dependent malic enzyme [Chlamydiales bacterium]